MSELKRLRDLDCQNSRRYSIRRESPTLYVRFSSWFGIYGRYNKLGMVDWKKADFVEWMTTHPMMTGIWDEWVMSGYEYRLTPSCMRIDTKKPFSPDNCVLVQKWMVSSLSLSKFKVGYFGTVPKDNDKWHLRIDQKFGEYIGIKCPIKGTKEHCQQVADQVKRIIQQLINERRHQNVTSPVATL